MVNIERDSNGKTRVAKGDKSGLGGQYAPDVELLKKYATLAKELTKKVNTTGDLLGNMSMDEYDEAVAAQAYLENFYREYNKEQQEIANNEDKEETVTDGTFTYFPEFNFDTAVKTSVTQPHSEDGQPKGWVLRAGTRGSSSFTGTGYYATREEALASLDKVQQSRLDNQYVQEQASQYDPARESKEAIELDRSVPKGPWTMELKFIEPVPSVTNPKENGYHAGWCLVAKSPNSEGDVFVSHQGYKTRGEALDARNLVVETMEGWAGKDRVIFVEGQGNIAYNNMSSETYDKVINSIGFQPRPWAAADILVDYYPKSNYQGD